MSTLLDQAAKADPQRRADLERNDDVLRAAVDGRACRATGNHRSSQNDEPEPFTEAELLAGDMERQARRDQRFRQILAMVHEAELAAFRRAGWL